jgi:hypothetical protein
MTDLDIFAPEQRLLQSSSVRGCIGNAEVVQLCKAVLREARKGQLTAAAFVATQAGNDRVAMTHAGAVTALANIRIGLTTLAGNIEGEIDSYRSNPVTNAQANTHEYNLLTDPLNFDFLIWLVEAEMIRVREGAPPPLRVHFANVERLDGPSREKGRLFFENVHRPLLPLVGAVEVETPGGWRKATLTPSEIVAAARRGEKVPILRADANARAVVDGWLQGKKAPVTITLREATHWPARNSNVSAWLSFARCLRDMGENVVFVRDTEKGNEPLEDFLTCPFASFNVTKRMALYERAKINLFTSNGPAGLGLFSTTPYLYFIDVYKDPNYPANNPEWWLQHNGIGKGEQWPWAKPDQRMIWKPDTYENICEAWERSERFRGGWVT